MQIMFQNVRIAELPKAVFPSAVAEIRMDDISTKVIRRDAFCAMTIFSVVISNASIQEIQSGAFSDRALIHSLEFVDVQLKKINTAAFRAGHDNLTIQYSRSDFTRKYVVSQSGLQSTRENVIDLRSLTTAVYDNNVYDVSLLAYFPFSSFYISSPRNSSISLLFVSHSIISPLATILR